MTLAARAESIGGELWGGLAAMLVALPSAIAFGLVVYAVLGPGYAAQGALAGIFGTITIGIVAPLLGGAPRLISAPSGPAAAVLAAVAAEFLRLPGGGTRDPQVVVLMLMLVGLLCGGLQLLFGAAGGGRLIKYIPYPVVAGYLSGVGLLIFLGQMPRLLGLPKGASTWGGIVTPALWSRPALVVGLATMVIMTLAPRLTRRVPATILALGGGTLTYFTLAGVYPGLRALAGNPLLIGMIGGGAQSGLASVVTRWADISRIHAADLHLLIVPSLTLAVLLSIDTLKTCVVVDALTRGRHDSNRELRGQGLGNLAAAAGGGMAGSGMMGATLVNINSGGRTRLSGVLSGVFALVVYLLLGPLIAWVPTAALAGILTVVALRMVDRNVFQLLKHRSTVLDFVVVAAVVVTAVVSGLMEAAGLGVGLAILLFLREQIRGSVVRRKGYGNQIFSKRRRPPEERAVLEERGVETAICELQGSLFFGTTDQLLTELDPDLATRRFLILDMRRVQTVDFTATHLLEQIEARLAERDGLLLFSHLPPNLPTGQDLHAYFDQVGLVRPSRRVRVFEEVDEALEWVEERLLEEAGLRTAGPESPLALHEISLFKGIDEETLRALEGCVEERVYQAGEAAFSHGAVSDEIFLVRCGRVRIMLPLANGRRHHLATFGRGEFFGDMAFIAPAKRSADAEAVKVTQVFAISRARFDSVAGEHPVLSQKVFWRLARALALRLRQADEDLRALEEV